MNRLEALLDRLAAFQFRRAGVVVLLSFVAFAAALPIVKTLRLNSDFVALLPTDKPSVRDFERIGQRVGGLQTLTIVLESDDLEAMQQLVRDLVPRLERLGPPSVRSVDWNVHGYSDFVHANRFLFASTRDLEEVRDALSDRLIYERGRANPFFVQLDDEVPPDPAEVVRRIEERSRSAQERLSRFPGGFYVHPDGKLVMLFVRSSVGGSSSALRELRETVEHLIAGMHPTRYARDMRITYTGNVVTSLREHDAVEGELKLATTLSVVLVLGVIWLYFRKPHSIVVIGSGLLVPVTLTFAFAKLAVGDLNTSTAFLGSIVVGNGVNPFVVWLARYFEERRRGLGVAEALSATHRGADSAIAAASFASAVAYGSLIVTDFRGFRDFGIVGVVGMVLCWLATMLVFPSLVTLVERVLPMRFATGAGKGGSVFLPIVRLVERAPRAVLVVSSLLGLVGVAAVTHAIVRNPLEYDFRNLRSETPPTPLDVRLRGLSEDVKSAGRQNDGIAIVLDRQADAEPLAERLERMRTSESAPWGSVRTLQDLLPSDQAQKLEILGEIRESLEEFLPYADAATRARIEANLPPEDLRVLTLADLPEAVARPYSERDGTRGRLLLVERKDGASIWDGRYLMRWAHKLRAVRLPDGSHPPLAGRAPLFADMIESILVDGPRAVAASLIATIAIVVLAFRRWSQRLLTLASLMLGVVWMTGVLALMGMKLNFLNFVAFPITFGIGVEYAVNVMRRYANEEEAGNESPIEPAIAQTGGAVILCSATTVIGYATLLVSGNLALRSFGTAMAVSEVACILAAVVTLPAVLVLLERRRDSGIVAKDPNRHEPV